MSKSLFIIDKSLMASWISHSDCWPNVVSEGWPKNSWPKTYAGYGYKWHMTYRYDTLYTYKNTYSIQIINIQTNTNNIDIISNIIYIYYWYYTISYDIIHIPIHLHMQMQLNTYTYTNISYIYIW